MQISQERTCVGVFFNKVAGPQNSNFIKKKFLHRFFPVKFAKFSRTHCFRDHLQRLLLTVSGLQPATLLRKIFRQRCVSVNFTKFLRTSFDRALPYDCFLRFSVNFEKFFRTPLLYSTNEKLLTSCRSCRISTTRNSRKLFHKCFSSILCKNEK